MISTNKHKHCCCCCKIKKGVKIINGLDTLIATLFVIYVVIAASSLDQAFTTLSTSSSTYTSGSITSYDDFLKAFQGAVGAFVIIPGVILDIVLLPRIFTFILLSKDWRNL
jgi:hypothetical protein